MVRLLNRAPTRNSWIKRVSTTTCISASSKARQFSRWLSGKGVSRLRAHDYALWITRSHVHVDRVACPWLITRFIDNNAEFLFVPASQIELVSKDGGAIPFDAPGVELGHKDGRCSFESIILKYGLKELGLLRLARIVHSADVSEDIDKDPIAPGLQAIASGFSLRFPEDDENLANQFEVYDALVAWCRLQVAAEKK